MRERIGRLKREMLEEKYRSCTQGKGRGTCLYPQSLCAGSGF